MTVFEVDVSERTNNCAQREGNGSTVSPGTLDVAVGASASITKALRAPVE